MKARLAPVYFKSGIREDFDQQLSILRDLLADVADFLEPLSLGTTVPPADAAVFPQLVGRPLYPGYEAKIWRHDREEKF